MAAALEEGGFVTLPAQGTYFPVARFGGFRNPCARRYLLRARGPGGEGGGDTRFRFYDADPVDNVVRLCFAKQPETISAGVDRLISARSLFR
jgi:hypothetical protein